MPSITPRRARTFAGVALALASAAVLAGCASIDPVVLPDADSSDSSSSGNPEVDELTQEYNTLAADYRNGYQNLEAAMNLYHEACLVQLLETFTTHYDDLQTLGSDQLATIQSQAASNEPVDGSLVEEVKDGLAAATQYNATVAQSVTECPTPQEH